MAGRKRVHLFGIGSPAWIRRDPRGAWLAMGDSSGASRRRRFADALGGKPKRRRRRKK